MVENVGFVYNTIYMYILKNSDFWNNRRLICHAPAESAKWQLRVLSMCRIPLALALRLSHFSADWTPHCSRTVPCHLAPRCWRRAPNCIWACTAYAWNQYGGRERRSCCTFTDCNFSRFPLTASLLARSPVEKARVSHCRIENSRTFSHRCKQPKQRVSSDAMPVCCRCNGRGHCVACSCVNVQLPCKCRKPMNPHV